MVPLSLAVGVQEAVAEQHGWGGWGFDPVRVRLPPGRRRLAHG